TGNAATMPDGRLVHIQTCGQKNMPAYAPQVRLADRWRVVLYLRELQRQATASKP
ncbi:MAG: cytochrome c, partial [Armatimonadetes bacterium]|nr:cytochrome c [Armatimonadota bacterium]